MALPGFLEGDRDEDYALPLYTPTVVRKGSTLSKAKRLEMLQEAGFNIFNIPADAVTIDLLTDSGTGVISDLQLAAMMRGDESYAGARSYYKLKETVKEILGFPFMLPTHQGRAAEKTFNHVLTVPLVQAEQDRYAREEEKEVRNTSSDDIIDILHCRGNYVPQVFVPGNTHFDTTLAHIDFVHAQAVDLTIDEAKETANNHPFRGNIDTSKLSTFLEEIKERFGGCGKHIPYVLLTITCNSGGGQPVSLANIKATGEICKEYGVPLYFDAARYAENAYFIREREHPDKSIKEIILEMFSHADGCLMSSKKDGIVPMGGFIALRDEDLHRKLGDANILFEGYRTYGGMSGLMMEALAQGLRESADLSYLKDRIEQVQYLAEQIKSYGVPIIEPVGGHAVFIDGRKFYEGIIPDDQFPAQALTAFLYAEAGVRGVEVGSNLKGRDPLNGENRRADLDLLRLAVPRRKYAREHMDAVARALGYLYKHRAQAVGLKIAWEPDEGIRHFSAKFELVNPTGRKVDA